MFTISNIIIIISSLFQKPSLQLAGKVLQTVLDSMGRYWPWGYSPSSLLPPDEMSPSFDDPGLGGGGGVTTPNADAISAISQTAQLINVLLPNLFKFSLNNSTVSFSNLVSNQIIFQPLLKFLEKGWSHFYKCLWFFHEWGWKIPVHKLFS